MQAGSLNHADHHGPLFTIGIPVRSGMPWLRDSIQSLIAQTCPQFQVLVILDGPDPDSRAYLDSVYQLDLRVIERPAQGLVATLNDLLHECHTPWLVRQDADDIAYPQRIEKLRDTLLANPSAGMISSRARYHADGHAIGRFRSSHGSPAALRRTVQGGKLLSFCHSSVALRVETALTAGGYRSIPFAEDADLWWRMALLCDIFSIPDVLTGFRQNPSSISTLHHDQQQIAGFYVQYLLLSTLWGLTPRPFPEVSESLASLVPPRWSRAKRLLRNGNIALGESRYLTALSHFAASFAADPFYLLRRLHDEFTPRLLANGLPPEDFWRMRQCLWT
jgi:cellulose synthase/poly-beta-1,6-N-acetylglucosamine synthase-like glycosyltransferase